MDLLQDEATRGDISLRRIFEILGEEGHAVLLLFFCLPFLQPIPIPGLSTPLGFLIILIAIYLFRQVPPWLPKRYEELKISAAVIIRVSNVAERIWRVVSKIVKARLEFLHDLWLFRAINLCIFVGNAILLSLPLPIPFSNTIPAIGIILCAIGHIEKDGIFILFSYLWCLIVASFFASLTMGAAHYLHF
jgi:hypothetical protein